MARLALLLIMGSLASGCSSLSGVTMKGGWGGATQPERIETLAVGQGYSNLESQQKLINNKLELAAWLLSNEGAAIEVAAATQEVDFATHKLIYVAAGMKPHAGYTLAVSRGGFRSAAGAASLQLILKQPVLGSFYSPKVASPYILLKVPSKGYRRISIGYEACDQTQMILVSR